MSEKVTLEATKLIIMKLSILVDDILLIMVVQFSYIPFQEEILDTNLFLGPAS